MCPLRYALVCLSLNRHILLFLQIPTFALFRKWKAFSVWRQNVRSKKITSCKKALNENLFIVNMVRHKQIDASLFLKCYHVIIVHVACILVLASCSAECT